MNFIEWCDINTIENTIRKKPRIRCEDHIIQNCLHLSHIGILPQKNISRNHTYDKATKFLSKSVKNFTLTKHFFIKRHVFFTNTMTHIIKTILSPR